MEEVSTFCGVAAENKQLKEWLTDWLTDCLAI
jgi:hypothetical protein